MRPESTSAQREHELAVIDAAVRGGGQIRPEDAEIVDFALLVRSARPVLDHGAVARLDARLAEPASKQVRGRHRGRTLIGALASLVLVAGVVAFNVDRLPTTQVTPVLGTDDSGDNGVPGADGEAGLPRADDMKGSAAESQKVIPDGAEPAMIEPVAPLAKAPSGLTSAKSRRQELTAQLSLAVTPRRFDRAADRIIEITTANGGFVQNAWVRVADRSRARGTFLLMIPAANYQEVAGELAKVGHVRSRSEQTTDITSEYNSAERTLQARRDRVRSLQARLNATEQPAEVARLEAQLRRARIAEKQAERAARGTRARVNYVPTEVRLSVDKGADAAGKGTLAKAFSKSGEILTQLLAWAIIALSVLLPIGLIVAAAMWIARMVRRRRADGVVAAASAQSEKR